MESLTQGFFLPLATFQLEPTEKGDMGLESHWLASGRVKASIAMIQILLEDIYSLSSLGWRGGVFVFVCVCVFFFLQVLGAQGVFLALSSSCFKGRSKTWYPTYHCNFILHEAIILPSTPSVSPQPPAQTQTPGLDKFPVDSCEGLAQKKQ